MFPITIVPVIFISFIKNWYQYHTILLTKNSFTTIAFSKQCNIMKRWKNWLKVILERKNVWVETASSSLFSYEGLKMWKSYHFRKKNIFLIISPSNRIHRISHIYDWKKRQEKLIGILLKDRSVNKTKKWREKIPRGKC